MNKYELLLKALVESTRLNYSKTTLAIEDDADLIVLFKYFEPELYAEKFAMLQEAESAKTKSPVDESKPFAILDEIRMGA